MTEKPKLPLIKSLAGQWAKKLPSGWKNLLLAGFVLVILAGLFYFFVDWRTVLTAIRSADRSDLALGIAALLAGYLLYAVRWRFLMHNRPPFAAVFHAANAGHLISTLLPARAGDPARILLLSSRTSIPALEVTSSLVVEQWFEMVMRLAAVGGALVFGTGLLLPPSAIIGSVAFLLVSFVFMLWLLRQQETALRILPAYLARLPRVSEEGARRGLQSLIDGLVSMASAPHLMQALLWSVLTWTLFWGFHFLCLRALRTNLTLEQQVELSLAVLALVPPSATTLPGIYQVVTMVPLGLLGFNESLLAAYTLLMNVIEMLVIGGLGILGIGREGASLEKLIRESLQSTQTETKPS